MPRTDEKGNLEFHSCELPNDYQCGADIENPFTRAPEQPETSRRTCKCGKTFDLHVKYDPTNYLHQLCEDCIIALPPDPNQRYPEQTYQTMTESISMGRDEL